jgi:hypothetical protein
VWIQREKEKKTAVSDHSRFNPFTASCENAMSHTWSSIPHIALRYDKKLYYPLTSDPVLFIYRETKDSTTAESVVRQSY